MPFDSAGDTAWLEEPARVVETFPGGAWIETLRRDGCSGCSAARGCGTRLLSSRKSPPRLQISTDVILRVGDCVRVGVPARGFLSGALMVYGWPLLLAILLGGIAEGVAASGHMSVPLAFLTGLFLGVCMACWHAKRRAADYRPVLLAADS